MECSTFDSHLRLTRVVVSMKKAVNVFLFVITLLVSIQLQASVRINEFMASNSSTLMDEDGAYSDWIELYNDSDFSVNLGNWSLTDDADNPTKWKFPSVEMPARSCLVVFATDENRKTDVRFLHTNFKLSASGEYLALFDPDGKLMTVFDPMYPPQFPDVSYGYASGDYVFLPQPSPGIHSDEAVVQLTMPDVDLPHGFYEAPFALTIGNPNALAEIYYTTDGSVPSKEHGTRYTAPIPIAKTTVLRAIAVWDGFEDSRVRTQTYLFLDDVLKQGNRPEGYPDNWGPYTALSGVVTADYEMDPDLLQDPIIAQKTKQALLDLPTLSLVTDKDHFFSLEMNDSTGGIYVYTGAPLGTTTYGPGRGWERPVSVEFFDAKSDLSIQIDAGIRLQGGHSRRHEKNPKHSFLLLFKDPYGPKKLDLDLFPKGSNTSHNKLVLRAGFGNNWLHQAAAERMLGSYQRDIWGKDTQRAMGHPSSQSKHMHLYINGIYWGMYAPSERMDKDFAEAYLGGDAEEYDVIKDYAEVADGTIDAWKAMMALAKQGLETNEAYQRIQGRNPDGSINPDLPNYVDVVNLADYMLINFYGANTDWDHHNWAAMRNRNRNDQGFRFFCWDGEHLVKSNNLNGNVLSENNANSPSYLFQQLMKNADFKALFANRVQKHCFNGGVLTPAMASGIWSQRSADINQAVYAESARWGDYRRDVHRWQGGPYALYTVEDHWLPEQQNMLQTYFPARTDVFVSQLKSKGFYPSLEGPRLRINGSDVYSDTLEAGSTLTMLAAMGPVLYTTTGVDPKDVVSGEVLTYSGAMPMKHSTRIMARNYLNGEWSPLVDKYFYIPADREGLQLTEIHYHPHGLVEMDGDSFEFLELKNASQGTLDLSGMRFSEGIDFTFPKGTYLEAGAFVVLAENRDAFVHRYAFEPFGIYGGKLSNDGERLVLLSQNEELLMEVIYGVAGDWSRLADGGGYSLVPVDPNRNPDPLLASNWRRSHEVGGSPGADDVAGINYVRDGSVVGLDPVDAVGCRGLSVVPNPFDAETLLSYEIPSIGHVRITVQNIMGLRVAVLFDGQQDPGSHTLRWVPDADLPAGMYVATLEWVSDQGKQKQSIKMMRVH